jgi:hypothetical protein
MPLAEWLPLALAIGATWSGMMTLAGAARVAAITAGGPTTVRIAAWLAVAVVLWLVPFGLGWLAGRISRKRRGRIVTVVLKSGGTIAGTLHHATETEFTLADATLEARRYDLITINRCEAGLVLQSRHVAADSPDNQLTATPRTVARGRHDDPAAGVATARAAVLVPPPARRPPSSGPAIAAPRDGSSTGPARRP